MGDGTSSMGAQMQAAKDKMIQIMTALQKENPTLTFRTSFVLYRDLLDATRPQGNIHVAPFTTDSAKVSRFIQPHDPIGGADIPEDMVGGLMEVVKLQWEGTTRVCIHFADAPCHGGKRYHECHDDHPKGVAGQPTPEEMMQQLAALNVAYRFVGFNASTDKMCKVFREAFDKQSALLGTGDTLTFEDMKMNGCEPAVFMDMVQSVVSSQIRKMNVIFQEL